MNAVLKIYRKDRHVARLIIMIVAWLIFMAITQSSKFFSLANAAAIASKFPEYGIMALGTMLCMITGGIDLSSVGIANMTSILMALYMNRLAAGSNLMVGVSVLDLLLIALLIGCVCGVMNGVLISKIRIPPILATLGVNQLLTGIALVVTNGKAVSGIPSQYSSVISHKFFNVVPGKRGTFSGLLPVQLLFFIAAALLIWFLLTRTTYGKKLYLLGTSEKVARFSGLKVDWLIIKTYALSGALAALGGMIMLGTYSTARSDYGTVYTLQCILIVVLGGVSPTGGKGKISGVILAIILLSMLEAGINRFEQVSPYYIPLIWGAVLLVVMVLNYFVDHPIIRRKAA